ncbi:protogloblin ApPgb [Chloroflexia bacterium SDU3-3]|nr:protogloblin ApPgb [Chloroflexia bacterium SDU3-3]
MAANMIPGYRLGDQSLSPSPLTAQAFADLKAALLFGDADVSALRRARPLLISQMDAILDVWYGFVGSTPALLAYFSRPDGPSAEYLARVRARFGQWIDDTCRAEYDDAWLAYQHEIGRRHFTHKNEADGAAAAGTPPIIHWRYVNALIYPIYATVRPFLERGGHDAADVEAMHQAWLKSVLLQVTLWSHPYIQEGGW